MSWTRCCHGYSKRNAEACLVRTSGSSKRTCCPSASQLALLCFFQGEQRRPSWSAHLVCSGVLSFGIKVMVVLLFPPRMGHTSTLLSCCSCKSFFLFFFFFLWEHFSTPKTFLFQISPLTHSQLFVFSFLFFFFSYPDLIVSKFHPTDDSPLLPKNYQLSGLNTITRFFRGT